MALLANSLLVLAGVLGFGLTPWLAQRGEMYWCGVTSTLFLFSLGASYLVALRYDQ